MSPNSWPARALAVYAHLLHLTPPEERHEWNRHAVPHPSSSTAVAAQTQKAPRTVPCKVPSDGQPRP